MLKVELCILKMFLLVFPFVTQIKLGIPWLASTQCCMQKNPKSKRKKKAQWKAIKIFMKFFWRVWERGIRWHDTWENVFVFFFNISPWQLHAKLHPSSSSSHPSHLLWDPFCSPSSSGLFPLKTSLVSLFFPVLQPHVSSVSTARC